MAQSIFRVDELARLFSCHPVSFSRSAAVSLAWTCKMLEVLALSPLRDPQDSLSVLSDVLRRPESRLKFRGGAVLPATDEIRNP